MNAKKTTPAKAQAPEVSQVQNDEDPEGIKAQARALFAEADAARAEVERLENLVEQAEAAFGDVLSRLHALSGPGPYDLPDGRHLTIVERKKQSGGSTWFFKGNKERKTIKL